VLNRLFHRDPAVLVILILVTGIRRAAPYHPGATTGRGSRAWQAQRSARRCRSEGRHRATLLPPPELRLTQVRMGPADAPVVEIDDVRGRILAARFPSAMPTASPSSRSTIRW